jgi:hypothetical protein
MCSRNRIICGETIHDRPGDRILSLEVAVDDEVSTPDPVITENIESEGFDDHDHRGLDSDRGSGQERQRGGKRRSPDVKMVEMEMDQRDRLHEIRDT